MGRYVWWHSGYDRLCHAFSVRQASEVFFEAVCAHSVPPEHVLRAASGTLCVPCLVEVGSALEDDRGRRD